MIPRHAGAVKMCEVLRNATKPGKPEQFLDQLCLNIEKSQVAEINSMTQWLKNKSLGVGTTCKGKTSLEQMDTAMGCGNGTCDGTKMFMQENMVMHGGMALEFTCDAAVDFVRGMIPHHKGAIKMCEILRNVTKLDPFLSGL